jgi:hypothetical protein
MGVSGGKLYSGKGVKVGDAKGEGEGSGDAGAVSSTG